LNATTFAHWVQRSRRDAKAKTLTAFATPCLAEMHAAASMPPAMNVPAATTPARLSVSFPDGVVVRRADPAAPATLVRALRSS
jgi:hypothetical protein